MRIGFHRRPEPRHHLDRLAAAKMSMHIWRANMRVYPTPGIKEVVLRLIVVMVLIVLVVFVVIVVLVVVMLVEAILAIVVMMVAAEMIALHVDSAVKIGVRLVYTRLAYRLTRIAERDGKSAFAFHDLGHAFDISAAETNKAPYKRDAADAP